MARWVRLSLGIVLAVTLLVSFACSMPETACSATSAQPEEAPTEVAQPERAPEEIETSGSVFDDPTSGFGVFPAFVPPIGLGSDAQECELGNDPYSTCI